MPAAVAVALVAWAGMANPVPGRAEMAVEGLLRRWMEPPIHLALAVAVAQVMAPLAVAREPAPLATVVVPTLVVAVVQIEAVVVAVAGTIPALITPEEPVVQGL